MTQVTDLTVSQDGYSFGDTTQRTTDSKLKATDSKLKAKLRDLLEKELEKPGSSGGQLKEKYVQDALDSGGHGPRLSQSRRRLYIMRHAERIDRIFPGWIRLAFTETGKYRPYDLNLPLTLPKRSGGIGDFNNDSPITEMGYVSAQMVGRGLKLNRVNISEVFTSPSLRCVQTAHGVVKTLGNPNIKMNIEPGLFEWMGWYDDNLPTFMTPSTLISHGYKRINESYQPIMSLDHLYERQSETSVEYYARSHVITTSILNRSKSEDNTVLLVCHASSLDACNRILRERSVGNMTRMEMDRLGIQYPYCSIVALEEMTGKWCQVPTNIPPVTYLDFTNRANYQYFNRP